VECRYQNDTNLGDLRFGLALLATRCSACQKLKLVRFLVKRLYISRLHDRSLVFNGTLALRNKQVLVLIGCAKPSKVDKKNPAHIIVGQPAGF
jgi:hypothetical protein